MKNSKKLIAFVVALMTMFVMTIPTFAVAKQNIYIPANQKWTTAGQENRTMNYETVSARCHSVYPNSGTDNFEKIQCQVTSTSNVVISDKIYILDETSSSNTKITIKQGYLDKVTVNFQFRGNTASAANAVVSYFGFYY